MNDDASCGPDVLSAVKMISSVDGESQSGRQVVAIAVR